MYPNTAAEIRPDLMEVVIEAAYAHELFIANKIFPLFGSATKNGEYRRIKKGSGGLMEMTNSDFTLRAPGTAYKRVSRTYEKDSFNCKDRGLVEPVDDSVQHDLSRYFDSESVSATAVLNNILRGQEKRIADIVQDPDVWGKVTAPVAYTPGNTDTVNVPKDIKRLKRQVKRRGEIADTIVMTEETFDYLTLTKSLREFFFGTQGGGQLISAEMFAQKFGFKQILLGDAVYSTAKAGKPVTDDTIANIWSTNYIWIGQVVGGPLEAGGAGRIVYWNEDCESEYVVETYRDEDIRSDMVRVRQNTDDKVCNENAGLLLELNFEPEA